MFFWANFAYFLFFFSFFSFFFAFFHFCFFFCFFMSVIFFPKKSPVVFARLSNLLNLFFLKSFKYFKSGVGVFQFLVFFHFVIF